MKKILQISLLCLISFQIGNTQSLKAYLEAAEAAYLDKDFYSSLSYYNEALSMDKTNIELMNKVAESARLFNSYTMAEEKYTTLMKADSLDGKFPMAAYWLAEAKQKQGKYKEAALLYQTYITEFGEDDSYYSKKADKEMKACEWSKSISETPDESVKLNKLGTEVNTPYSEFSGVLKDDKLHYSSMQFEKNDDEYIPKRKISKIMISTDGELGIPMEGPINDLDKNTGNISYTKDGMYLFYTVCEYKNASEIRCDLYYRKSTNGTLGEPVKLPEFINIPDVTNTQPSISHDKSSGMNILYYVSDRKGGKGKLDIWYTKIDKDFEFSEPINVSEINTVENEITPFFFEGGTELYFSSDGYQSLGGYDVFVVKKKDASFTKPSHLGPPTNSSYNDIYYSLNNDGTIGHLSSNRKGSLYLDPTNEGCCYDIYKLDIEPIEIDLLALTFDKRTNVQLPGATVNLYDAETNELLETVTNDLSYEHKFKLKKNRCYYIIADKATYLPDTVRFCTNNIDKSEIFTKKLYLDRDKLFLDVLTFDKVNEKDLPGCTIKLIDSTDPNNVTVQENIEGNDFHFDLKPNRSYTIIGTHPIYGRQTSTINSDDVDDSGHIVKKLYFQKGLNLFLPMVLYFDNDRPEPRSQSKTTSLSYSQTYSSFIDQKINFMEESDHPNEIASFFDIDVRGGYEKMNLFLEGLTRALGSGEKLNVIVKGFASPRAATTYNLKLGQRRVQSLKNEITKFGNGVLNRYIQSGQLIITDVSLGENTAPAGVNDQYKNKKLSIYSLEASRERRIEILRVKIIK